MAKVKRYATLSEVARDFKTLDAAMFDKPDRMMRKQIQYRKHKLDLAPKRKRTKMFYDRRQENGKLKVGRPRKWSYEK